MLSVTKEFKWDMAHRLENHCGLCNNLHGHTYKMLVTFTRKDKKVITQEGSNEGMVLDFKELKNIVQPIVDCLDHAYVFNGNNKDSEQIAEFLVNIIKQKIFCFDFRTTAENMSEWFFKTINKKLINLEYNCTKIVLYETPTSYAVFKEGF